ncbi:MAG: DTW domain-containing protein [Deltaproteobacteria bacterium]|nr:DTW domain-containing protein [Deltaproteobacteria bacterium]
MLALEPCPKCRRPPEICVCDRIVPLPTRLEVLILQHPREQDLELGSAQLVAQSLPKARVVVGLSWPGLAEALGREADPRRWATVFPYGLSEAQRTAQTEAPTKVMDHKGRALRPSQLDGIVLLDGSWSQAKTLWWRNAWLLKLPRLLLRPTEPTIYGTLRKAPRKDYLSTLEAAAEALVALGESEETRAQLRRLFRTMVQRARDRRARPA